MCCSRPVVAAPAVAVAAPVYQQVVAAPVVTQQIVSAPVTTTQVTQTTTRRSSIVQVAQPVCAAPAVAYAAAPCGAAVIRRSSYVAL